MNKKFGEYMREKRLARGIYSVRGLAAKIGVQPSYISKIERGEVPPPSEERIIQIAQALGENPDLMLALAGRVASDLQDIIRRHPIQFAKLIRNMRDLDEPQIGIMVRETSDRYKDHNPPSGNMSNF